MTTESKNFAKTIADAGFKDAVKKGIHSESLTVLGESTSAGTKKTKRHDLAHDVVAGQFDIVTLDAWYQAVASDGVTNEYSSQSDVDSRISTIFNDMAGVNAEDTGGV